MNMTLLHKAILCAGAFCFAGAAHAQSDITNLGGTITAQYNNTVQVNENYPNLIDNSTATKYYIPQTNLWVQYQSPFTAVVTQYAITSANDAATRDPRDWTLQGSNNGTSWTTLDTRTAETFATRFLRKTYSFANTNSYLYYRLNITAVNGATATQFAEWELLAATPAAPTGLSVSNISNFRVQLNWTDNATTETNYLVERSQTGSSFRVIATLDSNKTSYIDSSTATGTAYLYRVRTQNAAGVSVATAHASISTTSATVGTDVTDFTNATLSDQYNTGGNEGYLKAFDNSAYGKYLASAASTWVQYYLPGGATLTRYAVTSANDFATRDPKNWVLQGSNNGSTWTTLSTKNNQEFTDRYQRKLYAFVNTTAYTYYRLHITANNGNSLTQFAELELYGTGTGATNSAVPAAPSGLAAMNTDGYQLVLTWTDNSTTETNFRVERSTDSVNWVTDAIVAANNTKYHSRDLTPLTTYYYRLRAENANGGSAYVFTKKATPTGAAPLTWREHWFEHDELLTRTYYNDQIAVYYDSAVSPAINWMFSDFANVWQYTKQNYGSFSDPRLYAVFHSIAGYSGGHPATTYDSAHDYHNTIDLGGQWAERNSWNYGASTHEVAHIVEFSAKNVDGGHSFLIWGDSKWAEIFNYDVYKRLGWNLEAAELLADMETKTDTYPRAGTRWFKNWFYPIYTTADSSDALNRYFDLLAAYFPQRNGQYIRRLNMGEFIHFWSGAAQYNLKNQADTAFGWNDIYEAQFRQAQLDYPFTYPNSLLLASPLAAVAPPRVKLDLPSIWPNPASGTVYLNGPLQEGLYDVGIYSLNGVRVKVLRVSGKNAPVSISGLPNGMYVFVVSDKNKIVYTKKIFVNNK
ncbi:fibronectin type III domain-containing protein [Chitinophaga horti]|uniref:Fibronectin type III domain-containing protein n=1 Tax=Chitinophaga horti TaxID=2920382 RepID=A0ABY6J5A7_9BACT|nr:fibronectin type III domain-containing protein [Chitinophaga horti]UYQ94531.1 fibronectin type III domain-containing protein [Chitinophaga horti]